MADSNSQHEVLEMKSEEGEVDEFCQKLQRDINCLTDDNRSTRKRALERIRKETTSTADWPPAAVQKLADRLLKPLLKAISDPIEKCREIALHLIGDYCDRCLAVTPFLPYLIPVAVSRLGMPDITEPSEELRLMFIQFLTRLVEQMETASSTLAAYLDDFIKILQRTIVDPFPDVKKESCRLCINLAPKIPETFHMQAESLISPLISTLTHQHYKVRATCLKAIAVTVQFGNAQCMDSVLSHLAQRAFDHSPPVRSCLSSVIGHWLLDYKDRYSYHYKLLPLLLTGFTDELTEIRKESYDLMEKVGQKYAAENEEELKDQTDFARAVSEDYSWGEFPRPCLGSRVLMYRCLSKIFPAVLRDMGDWSGETRIKAISLLEILLIHAEDNVTQHAEILLQGLYKACQDEERQVIKKAQTCSRLFGHYIDPEVWIQLVLPTLLTSSGASGGKIKANVAVSSRVCTGCLMALSGILQGCHHQQIQSYVEKIANALVEPEIRFSQHEALLKELLVAVVSLIEVGQNDCQNAGYQLFVTLLSLISYSGDDNIQEQAEHVLGGLAAVSGRSEVRQLFLEYSGKLLVDLKERHLNWIASSPERRLFDVLLTRAGAAVAFLIDDAIDMFENCLKVERDPETKLSFFSLLSRLLAGEGGREGFRRHSIRVIRNLILPNCVWSSGRTAAAIRTAAMTCLWTLLQSDIAGVDAVRTVEKDLFTQVLSCLDDSNQSSRAVSCKVLRQILMLLKGELDVDYLHQLYVDLLKRMDDSNNEIRLATTKALAAYFRSFPEEYDRTLYKAHGEAICKGLLVHLDDPSSDIQRAVLDALKESTRIWPEMLKEQLQLVRHKHRTTEYCDELAACLETST